jgi:hypothetical protein
MNYQLVTIHWVSMFLLLAGGVMLAVWLYQNLKPKTLLTVVILAIIVGLVGSYLTFEAEAQFFSALFAGGPL